MTKVSHELPGWKPMEVGNIIETLGRHKFKGDDNSYCPGGTVRIKEVLSLIEARGECVDCGQTIIIHE